MDARRLLERALSEVSGRDELAARLDSTLLSPTASSEDYVALVREAAEMGFRAAVVPSAAVPLVAREAERLGVRLAAVVGFPLGAVPLEAKLVELELALESGASEVDLVPWVAASRERLSEEIARVVSAAKRRGAEVKVIVEAPLVGDNRLRDLVEASASAGAGFVKTSTGVYSKGGDPATVARLARLAKPLGLKVKAAGGVRTAVDALLAIGAGADVIGTSSARRVVETFDRLA